MNIIGIQAISNQSFSVSLDGSLYDITIRSAAGCMVASIVRDNVDIIDGQRIVAGTFLLPYLYQEPGNFMIVNMNDDLIDYSLFGVSQQLVYLSAADLAALRA